MSHIVKFQKKLITIIAVLLLTGAVRFLAVSLAPLQRRSKLGMTISDRGAYKQLALRFTRHPLIGAIWYPTILAESGANALLRLANFRPYFRIERIDAAEFYVASTPENVSIEEFFQSCGDSDGDGDGGDGGDGPYDGNGGCDSCQ